MILFSVDSNFFFVKKRIWVKKDPYRGFRGISLIYVMYVGTIYTHKKFYDERSTGSKNNLKYVFLHYGHLSRKLLVKPIPEKI